MDRTRGYGPLDKGSSPFGHIFFRIRKLRHEDFLRRMKSLKKVAKEVTSSKEKSKDFLISAGIIDKDGNLTERYRDDETICK